ncbi:hypothetical protein M8C21_011141 [Ambrosia artemisiifolia]|uniref:Uncharacterized protein n=1 Tax=Ambrosia artemisiifolia TaxID=4212 RepID=A0AAD5CYN1_AMBAR|nr:hypothetical protein M8C21_011141 [Ambrosia artemisiifolia]
MSYFLTLKTPFLSSHSSSSSSVLASCKNNHLLRLSSVYFSSKPSFNRGRLRLRAESQPQDSSQSSNSSSDSQQPNGSVLCYVIRLKLRPRAESQPQDSSNSGNSVIDGGGREGVEDAMKTLLKQHNKYICVCVELWRELVKTSRRDMLLEYVKNVQPEFMELFVKRAPQQVVDAMRQTVTNMMGTLPPQFFAVTVTTVAENLAQLMYSVLMTGYMFRNAQYRLELQQSLEQVALPDTSQEEKDAPVYAPGTQKKVTGEVIRWNNVSGPEKIDAIKYIELLEAEVEELNRQVERISANGSNELLDYLKTLEPQNLKDLTSSAGEDVVVAMNTFIKRLLAVSDPTQMKTSVTETSAPELAKLLYWLMVVGYSIRNIEVRYDMERVLGSPPKRQELPPAENI